MAGFEWTADTAKEMIEARGYVVNIGQVTPAAKKWLDREVKKGRLVKYRGFWNTLSRHFGMGPLKTIWAIVDPESGEALRYCRGEAVAA